ncbi:MAG: tRNA-dihydrouridine synthase family protein [Kiritimatiellaeota bacterium]|nr:tRNA-dihydrouridine synthase family protein [Kiritimatiellota bacterium]
MTPVWLAPMAGFTDAAMRLVCHRRGASLCFTEMACATALARQPAATLRLLEKLPGEGPVAAHLFGSDPDEMAAAAEIVAGLGRFVSIDVNAGCPMRKVTARGCGAALMPRPALVAEIIRRMKAAQPLPVTLKTRLGLVPGKPLAFDLLEAAQDAGAACVTIHARYAADIHSGPPDLATLARVVGRARIPVAGNGGIRGGRDARVMVRETGVSAVVIGRAALGDPRVFTRVASALDLPQEADDGEEAGPVDFARAHGDFLEHLDACEQLQRQLGDTGDHAVVAAFRCHLFRYFSGMRGAAHFRAGLSQCRTLDDIRGAAREITRLNMDGLTP